MLGSGKLTNDWRNVISVMVAAYGFRSSGHLVNQLIDAWFLLWSGMGKLALGRF